MGFCVLLTEQLLLGRQVRHWVRPLALAAVDQVEVKAMLVSEEDRLIRRWHLREVGWNIR